MKMNRDRNWGLKSDNEQILLNFEPDKKTGMDGKTTLRLKNLF
jgi:hypothetical protein